MERTGDNMAHAVSVILPIYNEAHAIGDIIGDVLMYMPSMTREFEVVAVNDGSTDGTGNVLQQKAAVDSRVVVVNHTKNRGYGRAVCSGIKAARFPFLLIMDADGQFDIREAGPLLKKAGEFDIVTGYRVKRQDTMYRRALGRLYALCLLALFGLRMKDVNCGLKLIKNDVCAFEQLQCRDGIFYTELFLQARRRGKRIIQVPVRHRPRPAGKSTGGSFKVFLNSFADLVVLKTSWMMGDRFV